MKITGKVRRIIQSGSFQEIIYFRIQCTKKTLNPLNHQHLGNILGRILVKSGGGGMTIYDEKQSYFLIESIFTVNTF